MALSIKFSFKYASHIKFDPIDRQLNFHPGLPLLTCHLSEGFATQQLIEIVAGFALVAELAHNHRLVAVLLSRLKAFIKFARLCNCLA